jgi:NitT/TauT family transport system permease protein
LHPARARREVGKTQRRPVKSELSLEKRKPYLWGLYANPPKAVAWCYRLAPFVAVLVVYQFVSLEYLAENPDGKIFPSFATMGHRIWELAFVPELRTGSYPLWLDTVASLSRIISGMTLAAIVGLLLGINMALFPGMRLLALPFVTSLSIIPALSLLPILLILFGIGDVAKIMLIFFGVAFIIARDLYTTTTEIPRDLLVKAQSLGASQFALVYRIALPMVMPRLIEAVRQSLGPAWLFLIASEGIASTEGLGYRIFLLRRYLDMAAIIPYVVWITLLAFLIDRILAYAARYLFPWKR